MRWLLAPWRAYQRWFDVKMLWPPLVQQARDRLQAEGAFRIHMEMDPAYSDMDEWDKTIFVKNLPWPKSTPLR